MELHKPIAAILVAAMLFSLSSCISAESDPPSNFRSNEKITLSFMASEDWVQDAELDLARKFDENESIGINYQIFPSSQYTNLLMTKLNAGECPDIFAAQCGKFDIQTQYHVESNAVDLTDTNWAADVDTLAAAELTINGRLYGQPIQDVSAVWAVAYNKKIFNRLNLSIPNNYAEFLSICSSIQAAGTTPIYECMADGWHHTLWFVEPCIVQEKLSPGYKDRLNKNTASFAQNDNFIKILNQIQEMVQYGFWGDHYISNTYLDAPTEMASEKYAMVVFNQGLGDEIHKIAPDFSPDDIGYFVIPLADNQSLNINPAGPARFIYSGTQNLTEALKYFDFLASEESLSYLTAQVPKYNKLPFNNAPITYSPSIQEFYSRYPDSQVVYQTAVKYVNPQWAEIGNDISRMLAGEISAEQVLESIDKRRREQAIIDGDLSWK